MGGFGVLTEFGIATGLMFWLATRAPVRLFGGFPTPEAGKSQNSFACPTAQAGFWH